MKGVKRWSIEGCDWELIRGDGYVRSVDYDAALSKLAAETLRADTAEAELVSADSDKEAYAQNAIDLRKRAEAAEQRVSELTGLLQRAYDADLASRHCQPYNTTRLMDDIEAALNPKPEAGSHDA